MLLVILNLNDLTVLKEVGGKFNTISVGFIDSTSKGRLIVPVIKAILLKYLFGQAEGKPEPVILNLLPKTEKEEGFGVFIL
jgi:hypothetical protein